MLLKLISYLLSQISVWIVCVCSFWLLTTGRMPTTERIPTTGEYLPPGEYTRLTTFSLQCFSTLYTILRVEFRLFGFVLLNLLIDIRQGLISRSFTKLGCRYQPCLTPTCLSDRLSTSIKKLICEWDGCLSGHGRETLCSWRVLLLVRKPLLPYSKITLPNRSSCLVFQHLYNKIMGVFESLSLAQQFVKQTLNNLGRLAG